MSLIKFFIIILFLSTYFLTIANDANLGSEAGFVFPIGHNSIQMIEERVNIDILSDSINVRCNFAFFNHGKKVNILMGFPAIMCNEGDIEPIRNFRAFINGSPVKIDYVENKDDNFCEEDCNVVRVWYTWEITVEEKDSFKVTNTYSGDFGTDVCGKVFTYYTIGTGSTWFGKILKGAITFTHSNVATSFFRIIVDKDKYLSRGIEIREYEDSVSFLFREYEPTCDERIGIEFIGFFYIGYKNNVELCKEVKDFISELNYPPDKLRIMRNEIFARRGYIFTDQKLFKYFSEKMWYRPNKQFRIDSIFPYEKILVEEILNREKRVRPK